MFGELAVALWWLSEWEKDGNQTESETRIQTPMQCTSGTEICTTYVQYTVQSLNETKSLLWKLTEVSGVALILVIHNVPIWVVGPDALWEERKQIIAYIFGKKEKLS